LDKKSAGYTLCLKGCAGLAAALIAMVGSPVLAAGLDLTEALPAGAPVFNFYAGPSYGSAASGATFTSTSTFGSTTDSTTGGSGIGAEMSAAVNISRYVGLKADVSTHFGSGMATVPGGTFREHNAFGTILVVPDELVSASFSDTSILAGLEFKDNASTAMLNPFVNLTAGVTMWQSSFPGLDQEHANFIGGSSSLSGTSLAVDLGGGVDVAISDVLGLRLQGDLRPGVGGTGKRVLGNGEDVDSTLTGLAAGAGPIVTSLQDIDVGGGGSGGFSVTLGLMWHPK
jgi:hypothetical protein